MSLKIEARKTYNLTLHSNCLETKRRKNSMDFCRKSTYANDSRTRGFLINFAFRSLIFRFLFHAFSPRWWIMKFRMCSVHMLGHYSFVSIYAWNKLEDARGVTGDYPARPFIHHTRWWLSSSSENGLFEFIIFLSVFFFSFSSYAKLRSER